MASAVRPLFREAPAFAVFRQATPALANLASLKSLSCVSSDFALLPECPSISLPNLQTIDMMHDVDRAYFLLRC